MTTQELESLTTKATPWPWHYGASALPGDSKPDGMTIFGEPQHKQPEAKAGNACCIAQVSPIHNTTLVDIANAELICEAVNNILRVTRERDAVVKALKSIIAELPWRRDWLNPDVERNARGVIASIEKGSQ